MEATYGAMNREKDYVRGLQSPLRDEYPLDSMASDEILTSRVQEKVMYDVWQRHRQNAAQDGSKYNAFERDIAVVNLFFGDSAVFGDVVFLILLSSWPFRRV